MYLITEVLAYHNETDRMNVKAWLERKYRGGVTRRRAVELGHDSLALQPSLVKRLTFLFLYQYRRFFYLLSK